MTAGCQPRPSFSHRISYLLMAGQTMAEFSWSQRFLSVILGPALFLVWLYFAPDYPTFFSTPLAQLTIDEIAGKIGYLVLLIPLIYATISWTYEALTGRDSVWFWHPDWGRCCEIEGNWSAVIYKIEVASARTIWKCGFEPRSPALLPSKSDGD
jgi:hypothetical protein